MKKSMLFISLLPCFYWWTHNKSYQQ